MSDKPTTGEWTGEFVAGLLYAESIESGIGDIIASHNAALAASVHYWQGVATQEWHKGFAVSHDEHQRQLVAERERVSRLILDSIEPSVAHKSFIDRINELENHLAAERERVQALAWESIKCADQHLQQLAAEREKYEKQRMATTGEIAGQSEKGNDPAANRDSDSFLDSRTVIKSYSAEAFAAEREKTEAACKVSQDSQRALWEATKQLVAEREKVKQAERDYDCGQLRDQLAAAQKALRTLGCVPYISREIHQNATTVTETSTEQQLAAERERSQTLVDALKRVRSQCQLPGRKVIDAALAKIGGGK